MCPIIDIKMVTIKINNILNLGYKVLIKVYMTEYTV